MEYLHEDGNAQFLHAAFLAVVVRNVLQKTQENYRYHGDVNLYSDCSHERLDFQVLFQLLEKQFLLPSGPVKFDYRRCGEIRAIGEEMVRLCLTSFLNLCRDNSRRPAFLRFPVREFYILVGFRGQGRCVHLSDSLGIFGL